MISHIFSVQFFYFLFYSIAYGNHYKPTLYIMKGFNPCLFSDFSPLPTVDSHPIFINAINCTY